MVNPHWGNCLMIGVWSAVAVELLGEMESIQPPISAETSHD